METLRLEAESAEMRADLGRAAEIRYGHLPMLQKELEAKMARLKKFQKSRRVLKEEITSEDIAEVVARWTGVPITKMLEEEREKLMNMENELHKRVVGQHEAIEKISMLFVATGLVSVTPIDLLVHSFSLVQLVLGRLN